MKKILLLVLVLAFTACQEEPNVDYALISGKVDNSSAKEIILENNFNPDNKVKIALSDDGTFSDTLRVDPGRYIVSEGRQSVKLYIEDGYNLVLNYDAKNLDESVSISGEGAEVSNYFKEKIKIDNKYIMPLNEFYSKNEQDYKEAIAATNSEKQKLLDTTQGLTEQFKAAEKRTLKYFEIARLVDYERAHPYFTRNPNFKVSDSFFDGSENIDLEKVDDFIFSSDYRGIVQNNFNKKVRSLMANDTTLNYEQAVFNSFDSINKPIIKNYIAYNFAKSMINRSEDLETFYNNFISISTNEDDKAQITKTYNELKALVKGNPSPVFANYENYKGGTTSLTDLKGKYVYVDVWATWCGPCKAEIPSLKKVEKQYHDKNIEFVSVSIDRAADHSKWKAMVEEKELGGIQLFADKDWKSKFIQDYKIRGIPRFILIDPSGNIVNANAPRPSDPSLVELFNSLEI